MPCRRRSGAILAVASCLAALAFGCARSEPPSTPEACLQGTDAYLDALGGAPRQVVTLGDGTPISDCLAPSQGAGELEQVGAAMVTAATRLNQAARDDGDRDAAYRLGYLLGAAQRGASETSGIHTDLIRRLQSAAQTSGSGGSALGFERPFARGLGDGSRNG